MQTTPPFQKWPYWNKRCAMLVCISWAGNNALYWVCRIPYFVAVGLLPVSSDWGDQPYFVIRIPVFYTYRVLGYARIPYFITRIPVIYLLLVMRRRYCLGYLVCIILMICWMLAWSFASQLILGGSLVQSPRTRRMWGAISGGRNEFLTLTEIKKK